MKPRRVPGAVLLATASIIAGARCTPFHASDPRADASAADAGDAASDRDGGQRDVHVANGLPETPPVSCGSPTCAADAECIAGQCAELFASEVTDTPVGVAVDDVQVYYTVREGGLRQKGKTATDRGAGGSVPLDETPTGPWGYLSRNGSQLDWALTVASGAPVLSIEIGSSAIRRSPQLFNEGSAVVVMANGDTFVTSFAQKEISYLPSGGNSVVSFEKGLSVEGLATDGRELYVARPERSVVTRLLPAPPTDTHVDGTPVTLALDDTHFYVADQTGGAISRFTRTTPSGDTIARVPTTHILGIAVDATHVYWADGDRKQILRVHK